MKHTFLPRTKRRHSFTLVELLVAMAVLSIMLIGLASSMDFVSRLWLNGIGAMDNFTKARVVLNLLDRDIQMMVLRRDVAAFLDGSGNPACAFYSNVQGNPGVGLTSPDTRSVSLVEYLVVNPNTTPTLERLNFGMNFLTNGSTPTVGTTNSLPIPPTTTPTNWKLQTETVFTGIILFKIQFVDGNGNILTPITGGSGAMTNGAPFLYDYPTPGDPANPRTVIVSMLVLSNPAYQIALQNPGIMTTLVSDFPGTLPSSNTKQTFSQYWNTILNPATGTLDMSLPMPVRAGIQVFERHIPLPITTPSA